MMSNFKATHYRNGTAIPYSTSSLSTGAYCYYATYDTAKYGMLYNYYAVIDVDSLAPTGWHVATNADYTKLVNSQGGASTAGGHLKEAGTADWTYPNTGADNSSGFTALPGGYYGGSDIAQAGNFWSSTASGSNAFYLYLFYGSAASQQNTGLKTLYLSVRCVKN
ncbi:MAG: fibrobacter succinogenes major paralogous domain-containing protein [Bacteroidales bacterium]